MRRVILIILSFVALLSVIYIVFNHQVAGLTYSLVKSIDKKTCSLRGGMMITGGCGIVGCDLKCTVPYRDGGKECANSSQCSHHCIVADDSLPPPTFQIKNRTMQGVEGCVMLENNKYDCSTVSLSGSCEKREAENCENRWELNDGTITALFASCTL